MQSCAIPTKKFALWTIMAVIAMVVGFLVPVQHVNAQGAGNSWCAQYRDKGVLGIGGDSAPKIHCFSTSALCTQTVQSSAAPGSVIAQCADVLNPSTATDPGQQRMLTQNAEAQQRAALAAAKNEDNIFPGPLTPIGGILAALAAVVFKIAGLYLTYMAKIMDWSISVSIDSQLLGSMEFVNIGWTAVRDFANMFFIFALLYLAIQTILGLAGGNAKRLLVHLIIAALLINFSLFTTKVVVDAGNIMAVSIWDKIKTQQGPATLPGSAPKVLGGLDLQTVFSANSDMRWTFGGFSYGKMFLAYTGGAIFMFIAGYIFLAGALMMITRTIMLLLLMVFSPFAFMSFGLPKFEQYGHEWLNKLIKQTFVAPFFIFMLYLNAVLVDKMDVFKLSGSKGQTLLGAFTGSGEYQIIFNFALVIGFLVASLAIANKYAGDVGGHARGWAKSATKWAGGLATAGAIAGGAMGMRQTLGKVGMMGKDNETLHAMAAEKGWRGMVGRGGIALSSGMARATYDPRATKYGRAALSGGGRIDIGEAGGKGGREATGSILGSTPVLDLLNKGDIGADRVKEVMAKAEQRYKNDPAGKEAFLRANLGSYFKGGRDTGLNRYENDAEFKQTRQTIDREKTTIKEKKNLRDGMKSYSDATADGKLNEREVIDGKETGRTIGEAAAQTIKDALGKLNGKEAADMLDNDQLKLKPVIDALNNQHLAALNARTDLNPDTIAAITNGVVAGGMNSAQKYLRNQARLSSGNGLFQVDAEKELQDLTDDYDKQKKAFDDNTNRTPEIEKAWKDQEREMKTRVARLLGMMETNEVAEMDNALITHAMIMEQYGANSKIQQKIRERLKNGAYDDDVAQKLEAKFGGQKGSRPTRPAETPLPTIDPSII